MVKIFKCKVPVANVAEEKHLVCSMKCFNIGSICGAVAAAGPWCTGIKKKELTPRMYTEYTKQIHIHVFSFCLLHLIFLLHKSSQI